MWQKLVVHVDYSSGINNGYIQDRTVARYEAESFKYFWSDQRKYLLFVEGIILFVESFFLITFFVVQGYCGASELKTYIS